jgi:hypothetical protein
VVIAAILSYTVNIGKGSAADIKNRKYSPA